MKRISSREIIKTAADKPGKGQGKIEEKRTSDKQPHFIWSYTFDNPAENSGYPVTSQRIHRTKEDAQVALDHFIRTGIVNRPDGSTYHYEAPQATEALSAPAVPRQKIPYEVWVKSKKSDGTTQEQWERRVDKLVSKQFGLGMADFPDWLSADAYEKNKTVEQGFAAFKSAQKRLGGFE